MAFRRPLNQGHRKLARCRRQFVDDDDDDDDDDDEKLKHGKLDEGLLMSDRLRNPRDLPRSQKSSRQISKKKLFFSPKDLLKVAGEAVFR